ncbi:DNA-binding protein [Psychromonas sp. KJ10-10]|uniref:DNA-binding protein n=1 Tax=Psychromonas sp. KJ10-10 TaxID=3391823 RepID=UPI0039B4363E
MTVKTNITFEQVSKVCSDMIQNGIQPSVRSVRQLTGGKTETVSSFLRDFHNKRDGEVSKMSDELGSSQIAKLLASEVQVVVDRKTNSLTEIVERQKSQIAEMIEILAEKETECQDRIELTEMQCNQTVNGISEQFEKNKEIIAIAKMDKEKAIEKVIATQSEAEQTVSSEKQRSEASIETSKSEAKYLIQVANKRLEKAELETVSLREQVKLLTVDVAKQEIRQTQYEQAMAQLEELQRETSDKKMMVVQLQTEHVALTKDNVRLEADLKESKTKVDQLSHSQVQLIEVQKQLSQSQRDFSQVQRERDSLSQALESIKFRGELELDRKDHTLV